VDQPLASFISVVDHHRTLAPFAPWAGRGCEGRSGSKGGEGVIGAAICFCDELGGAMLLVDAANLDRAGRWNEHHSRARRKSKRVP
jgi:hypothetical protein